MVNRVRTSGRRRQTHWGEMQGATTTSTTQATLLASSAGVHDGETIVRIRGLVSLSLKSSSAVGDGFFGAIGIGVVSTAAATAGVASIPTPLTEAAWDGWMLHQYLVVEDVDGSTGNGAMDRVQLDSKAMRKLTEDDSLVLVWEGIETGTATGAVQCRVRVLSMTG